MQEVLVSVFVHGRVVAHNRYPDQHGADRFAAVITLDQLNRGVPLRDIKVKKCRVIESV